MNDESAAVARRALALIDLTDLGDSTPAGIDALCARAAFGPHGSTAAVCVWPAFVEQCARLLAGTGVRVATVVNFPEGGTDVAGTVAETAAALGAGADEIDLVLPYRAFLSGRRQAAAEMVAAVRAQARPPALLKVILETGAYPNQREIAAAAELAIEQGADFVKTSTGKTEQSASPAAAATMRQVIRPRGRPVGFKPSGGIRTVSDAAVYLGLADEIMGPHWACPATFRFGASGLLDALEAAIEGLAPNDEGEPASY